MTMALRPCPLAISTATSSTLVHQLAVDPEQWTELVDYYDAERVFVSLYRDDHVDVWLLCWTPATTPAGMTMTSPRVLSGSSGVRSQSPTRGSAASRRCGSSRRRVVLVRPRPHPPAHRRAARSVSIHAYSPPLWRLGQYSITDTA